MLCLTKSRFKMDLVWFGFISICQRFLEPKKEDDMSYGRVLKIYVMGREPRSLKSVELVNWTGQAFFGRREHLAQAKTRPELNEPAIYMLLSGGDTDKSSIDIYIGETDNFSERLASHTYNKDWWSQFVVFVSKDKNLTKAHVKFLEAEIYKLAKKSIGTLIVKNTAIPSGASLPESDIASMREFLDNIIFVLESLGVSYFPSSVQVMNHSLVTSTAPIVTIANREEFYITLPKELSGSDGANLKSFMVLRNGSYILKEGSFVRKNARDSFNDHSYYNLWKQITESDSVVEIDNHLYKTVKDIEFRSPSGAGAIVRGGQTNGRTEWKRVSDDRPLNECDVSLLSSEEA